MYKSELHALCSKKHCPKPEFVHTCEGPVHSPVFTATVTLNEKKFCAGEGTPSKKEVDNLAARAALLSLADSSKPFESKTDFKTQLSVYAQKLGKVRPLYKHIQEGPAHAPRFNAEVTIDGQTFGRPELLYYKLKDAEAAAAEVALDLLPPIPPQESTIPSLSYKNFIQEIAQKEGILLPVYNTVPTNKEYSTAYKSSVQIKCEIFEGEPRTSKKQAEMNVAKIAYHHLALRELDGDDNERPDH